jgi:digeranylgeranylglycerophospholipid reductase
MSFDAIVVGGGPAGSTAARRMAARGLRVLLLEKRGHDREKPCAGGVTLRAVNEFAIPADAIDRNIRGDFVCSPKCSTVTIAKPYNIGACVMRNKFDRTLCSLAGTEGAEIRENAEVIEPLIENGVVVGVRCRENGEIQEHRARVTVIAEGSSGVMCRKLGIYVGDTRAIFVCVQWQMEMSNPVISERIGDNIELYFGNAIVPVGYAWIFPKNNIVSVGLGTPLNVARDQGIVLKDRLEDFILRHPVAREKLAGAKMLYSQGALIPHGGLGRDDHRIVSRIYGNGYLVTGDAAGFVSPATGEGIYYGMKSGEIAAEVAANAVRANDASERVLAEYHEKILQSVIYGDMKAGWRIRRMCLESDRGTERIVASSKRDPWFGEMTRKLISGEVPYPVFLKGLYSHPIKLLEALLFC